MQQQDNGAKESKFVKRENGKKKCRPGRAERCLDMSLVPVCYWPKRAAMAFYLLKPTDNPMDRFEYTHTDCLTVNLRLKCAWTPDGINIVQTERHWPNYSHRQLQFTQFCYNDGKTIVTKPVQPLWLSNAWHVCLATTILLLEGTQYSTCNFRHAACHYWSAADVLTQTVTQILTFQHLLNTFSGATAYIYNTYMHAHLSESYPSCSQIVYTDKTEVRTLSDATSSGSKLLKINCLSPEEIR